MIEIAFFNVISPDPVFGVCLSSSSSATIIIIPYKQFLRHPTRRNIMHYLGGKHRIAKQIIDIINQHRHPNQTVLEPFCGALNITSKLGGRVISSDANPYIIALYKAMQGGWIPPTDVSREEYYHVKSNPDVNPALTGFVGIGCSFSGKWWGGYAQNDRKRNYCRDAHNSLVRKMAMCATVDFVACDYIDHQPDGCLIYCDPPYQGTTGYSINRSFDHSMFWGVMREWSKSNMVLVSEYSAPDDFDCVLEIPTRLDMHSKEGQTPRIERAFKCKK